MAIQEPIDTQDFLTSFKRFMDKAAARVPVEEPIFLRSLRTQFATEPQDLPTVTEEFEKADHVNLHLALTRLRTILQNGTIASTSNGDPRRC